MAVRHCIGGRATRDPCFDCSPTISKAKPRRLRGCSKRLTPGSRNFQLAQRISGMSSYDISQPETTADGSATVTYRLFRQDYPRPDEGT